MRTKRGIGVTSAVGGGEEALRQLIADNDPAAERAEGPPIEVTRPVPDPVWYRRLRAIIEILLCSGIPTQLFVAQAALARGPAAVRDRWATSTLLGVPVAFIDTVLGSSVGRAALTCEW